MHLGVVALQLAFAAVSFGGKSVGRPLIDQRVLQGDASGRRAAKVLREEALISARRTLKGSIPTRRDPDRQFAAILAEHHADAIRFAQLEIAFGNDPAVRRHARDLVGRLVKERRKLLQWSRTAR
jgi:uncharacterized protein (DUF305 family)